MSPLKIIGLFALIAIACVSAIPAGPLQNRPIAPQPRAANPESEQLTAGADDDVKGSNSYGYGYYGGLGYGGLGYGGYGSYPYSYGYGYPGYSYYSSLPYYRGYGELYGG